jgi:hypothetical protein
MTDVERRALIQVAAYAARMAGEYDDKFGPGDVPSQAEWAFAAAYLRQSTKVSGLSATTPSDGVRCMWCDRQADETVWLLDENDWYYCTPICYANLANASEEQPRAWIDAFNHGHQVLVQR